MQKFDFSNLKLGDTVLTTNNEVGTIVALKSIPYLNAKMQMKSQASDLDILASSSFEYDNNRHKGIWYSTVTLAIQDKTSKMPKYYLEGVDFLEIKKIIEDKTPKKQSFLLKVKKLFKN